MKNIFSPTALWAKGKRCSLLIWGALAFPFAVLAQPANDNCSNATSLTLNTSCLPTSATTSAATASLPPSTLCNGDAGATADDDVWFKFTPSSSVNNIKVTGSVAFDAVIEVYSNACGGTSILGCADQTGNGGSESIQRTDFVPGQTYFFRVYHYGAGSGSATFDVCVTEFPPLTKIVSVPTGGNWSDPNTWVGGNVPTELDSVQITNGSRVFIDTDALAIHLRIGSSTPNTKTSLRFIGNGNRSLTVKGSIEIGVGDTLLGYGNGALIRTINIGGNLINNGYANFTRSNTTVTFDGDVPQKIMGTGTFESANGSAVIRTLVLRNTVAGLSVERPILVTLGLNLEEGVLTTNNNVTLDHTVTITGVSSPTSVTLRRGNGSISGNLTVPSNVVYNLFYQSFVSNIAVLDITSGSELLNGYVNALSVSRSSSTVSLNRSVHLKSATTPLTLTSGYLKVLSVDDTVKILNSAATLPAGNINSFIEGAISIFTSAAGQTRVFPMGTNGQYRPLTLTNIGGSNVAYVVRPVAAVPTGTFNAPLTNVMSKRSFYVTSSAALSANATVTLSYDADDALFGDVNSIRVAQASTATGTWIERSVASASGTLIAGTRTTSSVSLANGNFFTFATVATLDNVGATALLSPLAKSCYTANETIDVRIKNVSTSTISNIPVKVNIKFVGINNTNNTLTTIVSSLAPNAEAIATFSGVDMSAAGTYTLRAYTDLSNDGNRLNDTLAPAVFNNVAPSITSPVTTVCSGGSITLSVASPIVGTSYLWSNGTTANSISVSTAGTYTARAISGTCTTAISNAIEITIGAAPTAPTISGTNTLCAGGNTTLSVSSPVANTTYLWSNGTTGTSISLTGSGSFTVRAISNGCTSSVSNAIAVTVNPIPTTPNISGLNTFCTGSSTTLSVTNPVANTTYLWSNGTTANSISVNAAGSFSVRAISNTCTSAVSSTVNVTATNAPTATNIVPIGNNTCNVTLSANPNATSYIWYINNNITAGSSPNLDITVSGSYTYQAIANACTSAISAPFVATVSQTPTPTIAGNNSFCTGGNTTLSVTSPVANTTYLWSNGTTANSISVNAAGNFTVQAISGTCTSAVSNAIAVTVTAAPTTPTIAGNNSFCAGGNTTLSVTSPVANTTYLWSNGTTANSISVNAAGNFTVQAISGTCTSAVSNAIAVTVTAAPTTPTIAGNNSFCAGGNTTLSVTSPAANTTYLWSNGTTANSISVNAAGNFTVQAISGTCTSAVSNAIAVTVTAAPTTPTIAGNNSFCAGGNTTLSVSNPAANTTYLWSNGTTANSIAVNAAGNFTVQAISGTCTSAVSNAIAVTVTAAPTTPTIAGNNSFCAGGNTTLSVTSPAANTTYLWSNGTTANSISVNAAGNFTVQAISGTCTSAVSNAIAVTVTAAPTTPTIAGNNSFCAGGNTTLSVSSPVANTTYLWSNGTTANSISVNAAGNFTVQAISGTCTSAVSNAIAVTVTAAPTTPTIAGNNSFCAGGNTTLSVSSPAANTTYLWSNGTTANSISVNAAGNFTVQAISGTCTSAVSNAIAVTVTAAPTTPTIAGNNSFCAGGNTTLSVTSPAANTTYLWSNGTTANSISVNAAGNFTVQAISGTCTSAVSNAIAVTVTPAPMAMFSQNGNVLSVMELPNATYQWLLGGQPINNATGINYTALVDGNYSVVVTLNGCSTTSDVMSVVVISVSSKINNAVKVYPNPSAGAFTLTLEGLNEANIRITDALGRVILAQNISKEQTQFNLPKGLYFLQIQSREGIATKQVVVQ